MSHGDKQTEIGGAPEGWDVVPFSQFVSIQRGHDLTARQRRSGSVPVMGSAGLNGFHDQAIQAGPGMVLGRSGASYGQAHWCETDFWPHNTALYVTDFLGNDPRFAYYLLRATDFSQHNSGGAQQSLNRNFIAGMLLARPPRPEQERIRRCLDDAEAVVAGLERVIAKKRLIKQGAMQDLLTARRRLPGFSGEWEVKRLGEVARVATGGRNNQDKDPMGEYPFFVRSDTVERIRSFSYDCEAILVPGEGRIGEIFHYINGRFDVHQRVYCISAFSEGTSGRFIYFVLRQFFGAHAMINTVKATVELAQAADLHRVRISMPAFIR